MTNRTANASRMHEVPVTAVEVVLGRPDMLVVDLRSPSEFADDHLPGARNVPLFDDAERAIVGTLYRRRSPQAAFEAGRALVAGSISAMVEEIAALAGRAVPAADLPARVLSMTEHGLERTDAALASAPGGAPPPGSIALHCWRGGLRSRSVVAFLRELGWQDVYGLEGGYRSYRHAVLATLEGFEAPATYVLRGLTGVGKTLVLRELERLRPGWTLDLEGCAGHRSSILGMVGLEPVSQKTFESRLAARLREGFPGPLVLEGESRKVGDAIQPARIWQALLAGSNLLLVAPLERRIDLLLADYLGRPGNRAELRAKLPFIEQRLGRSRWEGELVDRLDAGEDRELCRMLLEHYYDPLYRHGEKGREHALEIDSSDPARAAREIAEWIETGP